MTERITQRAHKPRLIRRARRVVVKVGSNVLAGPDGLHQPRVRALARDVTALIDAGREVVFVTSGAVASGAAKLGPRKARIEWRLEQRFKEFETKYGDSLP